MLLEDLGLTTLRPVAVWAGYLDVAYLELVVPSFEGATVMAALLAALLLLGLLQVRFWCRHLCPLGALFSWLGKWAPYRRRVSDACKACNACARQCPSGPTQQAPRLPWTPHSRITPSGLVRNRDSFSTSARRVI